jgi:hypothetical protein
MKLKDAKIGDRVLIDVKSDDYQIVTPVNPACGFLVGTKISNDGDGYLTIGFRIGEKSANKLHVWPEYLKIDPLTQYINWFKPETICYPAKNRRYLA